MTGEVPVLCKNRKKDVLIAAYEDLFTNARFKTASEASAAAADEADDEGEDEGEDEGDGDGGADEGTNEIIARVSALAGLGEAAPTSGPKKAAVKKGPVISRGRDGGKKKPLKMKKAAEKLELDEDVEFKQRQKEEAARVRAAQAALLAGKKGKK